MTDIVLIAHNLRSTYNVGSLIRTAEGLAVKQIYLTGYTPYPLLKNDSRLPHMSNKISQQIHKTALGAEKLIKIDFVPDIESVIKKHRYDSFVVVALEQGPDSQTLNQLTKPAKIALIVGNEVDGLEKAVLNLCDVILEIPMLGQKESFNVVQAAAMALYHFRFC